MATTPQPGRVIALDPGTVRIGVAISDPARSVATRHSVINARDPKVISVIADLVVANSITVVVIGEPFGADKTVIDSTRMARSLADRVRDELKKREIDCSVELLFENYSSKIVDVFNSLSDQLAVVKSPAKGKSSRKKSNHKARRIQPKTPAKRRAERKSGYRDMAAAQVLLQEWLDKA